MIASITIGVSVLIGVYLNEKIDISNYFVWVKYGFVASIVVLLILLIVNLKFKFSCFKNLINSIKNRFFNRNLNDD